MYELHQAEDCALSGAHPASRLIFSLWRKANVNPTGKEILSIPFGFTVAQKDEIHVVILMHANTVELN